MDKATIESQRLKLDTPKRSSTGTNMRESREYSLLRIARGVCCLCLSLMDKTVMMKSQLDTPKRSSTRTNMRKDREHSLMRIIRGLSLFALLVTPTLGGSLRAATDQERKLQIVKAPAFLQDISGVIETETYPAPTESSSSSSSDDLALLLKPRVVGGSRVARGMYPYFCRVDYNFRPHCGGSLVAPDVVLSAAHCKSSDMSMLSVLVNGYHDNRYRNADQRFREVVEMRIHPNYTTSTYYNDVMLLKLNEPVNSKDIPFVELNRNPDLPRLDETVTVMGLGALYEGGDYPDLLQSVEVDMIDNEFCTAAYEDIGLFPIPDDIMLCAGKRTGAPKDACQGDSGGPLLNEKGVQVGIISFGLGCARKEFPGVYARTAVRGGKKDWIGETICDMTDSNELDWCPTPDTQASTKVSSQLATIQPTSSPTASPTSVPTSVPTARPTDLPTVSPTAVPTSSPTDSPTARPSSSPTALPTSRPTNLPTARPSSSPTALPTGLPTSSPTSSPTVRPSNQPTESPTAFPTSVPTASPTARPSNSPTEAPTAFPTFRPTNSPTLRPSNPPSASPTGAPSRSPTAMPTESPTILPTSGPTRVPTGSPSNSPTKTPTASPTQSPTGPPTEAPTSSPTQSPTGVPTAATETPQPTASPSVSPSNPPTAFPTEGLTSSPTQSPTGVPMAAAETPAPTASPSVSPSKPPTALPTAFPTKGPTSSPTQSPTGVPTAAAKTLAPIASQSESPSIAPTSSPTESPTKIPTSGPTESPTVVPTTGPTGSPTEVPTSSPTVSPTGVPTSSPTVSPTRTPTIGPSDSPTGVPTTGSTDSPTGVPTTGSTESPTGNPTSGPTESPTGNPTSGPTDAPTTIAVASGSFRSGLNIVSSANDLNPTGSPSVGVWSGSDGDDTSKVSQVQSLQYANDIRPSCEDRPGGTFTYYSSTKSCEWLSGLSQSTIDSYCMIGSDTWEDCSATCSQCNGTKSAPILTREFGVTNVSLVNAETDEVIPGAFGCSPNICLGSGRLFNIRANTSGNVGSVRLIINGPVQHRIMQNSPPWSLWSGSYDGSPLPDGEYVVIAQAFRDSDGIGDASKPFIVSFSVSKESMPASTAIPAVAEEDPCFDDPDGTFKVYKNKIKFTEQTCLWLKGRPLSEQGTHCKKGAFEFCRKTCGACQARPTPESAREKVPVVVAAPNTNRCVDRDDLIFKVYKNPVRYDEHTCSWLRSTRDRQKVCDTVHEAYNACRKTCQACKESSSLEAIQNAVPVVVAETDESSNAVTLQQISSEIETTSTTTTTTTTTTMSTTTAATTSSTTTFTSMKPPPTFGVKGFTLVDASTNQDIPAAFDCTPDICLGSATVFNIRADTFGSVRSVMFTLDGPIQHSHMANGNGPRMLWYSDGSRLLQGDYTVTAQAFTGNNGKGESSEVATLSFSVPLQTTTTTTTTTTATTTQEPAIGVSSYRPCIDEPGVTFRDEEKEKDYECSWLRRRNDKDIAKYCVVGSSAWETCRATCGRCIKCIDNDGIEFKSRNEEGRTCFWLRRVDESKVKAHCKDSEETYGVCRKTCGACY